MSLDICNIGASNCRMEREAIWFLLCFQENCPAAYCTWQVSTLNAFSCWVVIPRLSRATHVPQAGNLSRHITWKPFSFTHAQASTLEFLIQQFWNASWACVFSKCSPGNSVKFLPDSALGKHQCKLFSLLKSYSWQWFLESHFLISHWSQSPVLQRIARWIVASESW